jgi:hypothetical protein
MKIETDDDPFDMGKMALDAKTIAELMPFQKSSASKPKRRARAKAEFVMLPYAQVLAAAGQMKCAPLAVLIELAHQMFKAGQSRVTLTNSALRPVGISHKAKLRALRQLEAAGLVKVTRAGRRRSPRVTVLWGRN